MEVQLGGVPETLLITVRARAEETLRPDSLLQDTYAVGILKKLNLNFSGKKSKVEPSSQIGVVIRTIVLDQVVADFLQRKPDGIVVNLGCGLDARYERLKFPNRWYDIDLEEAIEIRKTYFSESDKYRMIAKSMLDYSWMNEIPKDKPVLIVTEGVVMYFAEEDLQPLVHEIFNVFPDVEMVFDTIAPFLAKRTNLHTEVKKYNAQFKWGLGDSKDLMKWNEHICILNEKFYFDHFRRRWPLGMRIMMLVPGSRKWNKIVHFGKR